MTTSSRSPDTVRGPARKMADIAPFYVMDILGRAKELEAQGREIIHMEVGEPDFPTPQPVIEAGIQALGAGHTHYTASLGIPALRQAIADFYLRRYGVHIPAHRIAITPGVSSALQLALATLIDPGDEVMVADPGYPCNRNMIRLFEGTTVAVPVGIETAYQLTPQLITRHATPSTSAIVLTTPSNPTGTLVTPGNMAGILREARRLDARVVVDEIYLGLVYDDATVAVAVTGGADAPMAGTTASDTGDTRDAAGTHVGTALALSDDIFLASGFSKYFGMTGWRLGWMIVPECFLPDIERLAQNLYLAPPTMAQYAALTAFRPDTLAILEARRQEFQRRRDFLLPALEEIGFHIPVKPHGAFYLYADCSPFSEDSARFADDLLENAGVAITPGIDFGDNAPERHVRFAYTTSMENLHEGVERLRRYLST